MRERSPSPKVWWSRAASCFHRSLLNVAVTGLSGAPESAGEAPALPNRGGKSSRSANRDPGARWTLPCKLDHRRAKAAPTFERFPSRTADATSLVLFDPRLTIEGGRRGRRNSCERIVRQTLRLGMNVAIMLGGQAEDDCENDEGNRALFLAGKSKHSEPVAQAHTA